MSLFFLAHSMVQSSFMKLFTRNLRKIKGLAHKNGDVEELNTEVSAIWKP